MKLHFHIEGIDQETGKLIKSLGLPRNLIKEDLRKIGRERGMVQISGSIMQDRASVKADEEASPENAIMISPCESECELGIIDEAWDSFN